MLIQKTVKINMAAIDCQLIADEIPYSGIAYVFVRSCPLSMLDGFIEYAAYVLSAKGATRVLVGISARARILPRRFNLQRRFTKLELVYSHDMLLLSKRLPKKTAYSHNVKLSRIPFEGLGGYMKLHNEIFRSVDNAALAREAELERSFRNNNYEIMHVMVNGAVAGVCEYEVNGEKAVIEIIGIQDGFKGHGYGTALMGNLDYILAGEGAKEAEIVVSSSNRRALGLYQKTGFHRRRTLSHWYDLEFT
jgi:ribosomal protein S18 acetylase RimI-like enzyme